MSSEADQKLVREVIATNRYLTLSTCDGEEPWIAPLEYMHDDRLNFFFFSKGESRHARHIERNSKVGVAIFDTTQPDYTPAISITLRGVQIEASARRLSSDEYPESVVEAIEALQPPMPPYHVYRILPSTFYVPKIVNGVNQREEVEMF